MSGEHDVIVVGAGVAGLTCAVTLAARGLRPLVVERSDDVGGRVRTDLVDGFRLDHGFQVLPTAYPEARRALDLERLDLRHYERGAIVRLGGRFQRVADPRSAPLQGVRMLASGVADVGDGLALVRLRRGRRVETTALSALRSTGMSRRLAQAFFVPFLRGVFLEPRLTTSSRFLDFVLDAFTAGPATTPARGMGEVPRQLAEQVEVRLDSEVATVGPGAASLASGEHLRSRAVVVAGAGLVTTPPHGWNGVSCLYFDAREPPVRGPWLVVNGEGGPVNNLSVLSEVSPALAPAGRALVSVTVLGGVAPKEQAVKRQLRGWFGGAVDEWRHLRTFVIPEALPAYPVGGALQQPSRLVPGLYACGDHRHHPSLNGAMASGRRAAEAVLADVHGGR